MQLSFVWSAHRKPWTEKSDNDDDVAIVWLLNCWYQNWIKRRAAVDSPLQRSDFHPPSVRVQKTSQSSCELDCPSRFCWRIGVATKNILFKESADDASFIDFCWCINDPLTNETTVAFPFFGLRAIRRTQLKRKCFCEEFDPKELFDGKTRMRQNNEGN